MQSRRRFGRRYEIIIAPPYGFQITIKPPITAQFKITRNVSSTANSCELTLYNLGPGVRNAIYKDRYVINEYWQMRIRAGYEILHTVFQGNIYEAFSYKQGTEWITTISGFDGLYGIQNGYFSGSFEANTPKVNILNQLINSIPNITAGIMGSPAAGTTTRGEVLLGQAESVLSEQTEGQYFFDNEVANVMANDEYDGSQVLLLDTNQILSTPRRRDTYLDVEMLFYPELKVGTLAEIRSLEAQFNGQYKILGFTHDVLISGATDGKANTNISLFAGTGALIDRAAIPAALLGGILG